MRTKWNKRTALGALVALGLTAACVPSPTKANDEPVEALERLAKQENPKALYHLGMMYLTGTSVTKDQKRAVSYFRRSSKLGDPLAAYKLGCFYDGQYNLFEVDLEEALKYKLVAAGAGYALAQQDVASLYYRRGEVELALQWLERAAAQGTPGALSTLASVYNGAEGIPKNAAKTFAYFTLFLRRTNATEEQKKWLQAFESKLTKEERIRADEIVRQYRPTPSVLTLEALSGMRAAEQLIEEAGASN